MTDSTCTTCQEGETALMPPLHLMIIAGEASGDLHGAHLIRALKARLPDVKISGVGGWYLQTEGMEVVSSSDELAVVGVSEVVKKLLTVFKVYRHLSRVLRDQRPDLLILVDYPEFNLRLARVAHRLGIPIVYYISPQVWAWRSYRAKLIQRLVTKMIVIFPFEREFYQRYGVDVEWVGHPLTDAVSSSLTKDAFCTHYGLDPARPIIGLLPGSRESEAERLLPVMREAAQQLHQRDPNVQFVLPVASSLEHSKLFETTLPEFVHLTRHHTYETIHAADVIVTASGTVTVEAAILETPMIITYIVSPLTYWLGRKFIKVPFIGMVNLIAGKQIVPELIQEQATPERIVHEILTLLDDPAALDRLRQELRHVHEKLGEPGAPARAAEVIVKLLSRTHPVS
ncbi:lipid-A-disaccharide synthase [candidate division KSB3 bacterium]|uniref:Lipid-A-disaccharide synthase n=1 Tax=candidate division KSB3 bacterium TaxID=2044937 RepID=A0A9D5Q4H8_9BACT|nr:lipid-A-disaccharide synthase [candidate division KSB3 bacterium]MBD3323202.1 lipid-A-disaccharide synthase [candidate division KSB3 bacterium]